MLLCLGVVLARLLVVVKDDANRLLDARMLAALLDRVAPVRLEGKDAERAVRLGDACTRAARAGVAAAAANLEEDRLLGDGVLAWLGAGLRLGSGLESKGQRVKVRGWGSRVRVKGLGLTG